jgi:hypothetical protein
MGSAVDNRLIPARFMLTMGHFLVTLCIFDTKVRRSTGRAAAARL